jgi:hypothetical protein
MLLFRLAKVLISIYISNIFTDFYSIRCVIDGEIQFSFLQKGIIQGYDTKITSGSF